MMVHCRIGKIVDFSVLTISLNSVQKVHKMSVYAKRSIKFIAVVHFLKFC